MSRLSDNMDEHLISTSELARKADLADNTVRRAMRQDGELRVDTKRRILQAMNEIMDERGSGRLSSSDLFDRSPNAKGKV